MDKDKWKKYWPTTILTALIAILIGFFQFMAIANVMWSIGSVTIYFFGPIRSTKVMPDNEGVFVSTFASLTTAAMFLTTTPAIIIAWAYSLRDPYEIKNLIIEAFFLSILLFFTAIAGLQMALAKNDMNVMIYGNLKS